MENNKLFERVKIIIVLIVSLILMAVLVSFVLYLLSENPSKSEDLINNNELESYLIEKNNNYFDYQDSNDCAAFASSYLLRHFGENLQAGDIRNKIKRTFGYVFPSAITNLFKEKGYEAISYSGNLHTLKHELTKGNPVIILINIENDTHYAVVVGYDQKNIYLVDSIKENVNVENPNYNRILTEEEFKEVWNTNMLLSSNIYIVIKNRKEIK